VKNSASLLLLLFLVLSGISGISAAQSFEGLASVTTARLRSGEDLSVKPLSGIGVILLAINDCTIKVAAHWSI
jgi:hypothetical protein